MSNNRRSFIKNTLVAVGALPVIAPLLASAQAQPKNVKFAKEGAGSAGGMGYCANTKDKAAVTKFCPKHALPENKEKFCHNCILYTAEKGMDYGKCAVIPEGMVKKDGYCNTWAKKA